MKAKLLILALAGGVLLASCSGNQSQSSQSSAAQSNSSSSQTVSESSAISEASKETSSESSTLSEESSSLSETSSESSEEENVLTSWAQITSAVYEALKTFTEAAAYYEEVKTPDTFFPVPSISKTISWDFDPSMNYGRGTQIGMVVMSGSDANENKSLVANYNSTLTTAGYTKLSKDGVDELVNDYWLMLYGYNVYEKEFAQVTFIIEVIPVADIEADGSYTFAPADSDSNPFTEGVYIGIQPKEIL